MTPAPAHAREAGSGDVGRSCPYCRFPFKSGVRVAACPTCNAAHHDECWSDNGGCAVVGCASDPSGGQGRTPPPRGAGSVARPPPRAPAVAATDDGFVQAPRGKRLSTPVLVVLGCLAAGAGGAAVVVLTNRTRGTGSPATTAQARREPVADARRGRTLFTDGNGTSISCAACHTLAAASATATTGPDLGNVLLGATEQEIRDSIVNPDDRISSGYQRGIMPANFGDTLTSTDIDDLVAFLHATLPAPAADGAPGVTKDGVLPIPADPTGQLAFAVARATAPAGAVKIVSRNDSSIPHSIAIDVNGRTRAGRTTSVGDSSVVSVTLRPGTYTYFCAVPGHRAGGMEGMLVVG